MKEEGYVVGLQPSQVNRYCETETTHQKIFQKKEQSGAIINVHPVRSGI